MTIIVAKRDGISIRRAEVDKDKGSLNNCDVFPNSPNCADHFWIGENREISTRKNAAHNTTASTHSFQIGLFTTTGWPVVFLSAKESSSAKETCVPEIISCKPRPFLSNKDKKKPR